MRVLRMSDGWEERSKVVCLLKGKSITQRPYNKTPGRRSPKPEERKTWTSTSSRVRGVRLGHLPRQPSRSMTSTRWTEQTLSLPLHHHPTSYSSPTHNYSQCHSAQAASTSRRYVCAGHAGLQAATMLTLHSHSQLPGTPQGSTKEIAGVTTYVAEGTKAGTIVMALDIYGLGVSAAC